MANSKSLHLINTYMQSPYVNTLCVYFVFTIFQSIYHRYYSHFLDEIWDTKSFSDILKVLQGIQWQSHVLIEPKKFSPQF